MGGQSVPPYPPLPDGISTLIKDCIAWKRAGQRQFYELYAPAVYNVIRRYIFNEQVAQEILNDSFYKIFTRLEQYTGQGPVEAWMRRIAVNTLTDYLRKHLRQANPEMAEVSEDNAYVDNEAVGNLSFAELIGCLKNLTDIQRAVFNLAVFESLSHKDIGEALSISPGNSRWILNDARKNLKGLIKPHEVTNMEQGKVHIDDLFRQKAQPLFALPPAAWDDMKVRLDRGRPGGGFPYRWLWYALLLLFVAGTGYYVLRSHPGTVETRNGGAKS